MTQPIRSRTELLAALDTETFHPHYLFFWGHRPSPDRILTKTCFSQWWAGSFTVDGITYPSAEHYMMAGKARLFGDETTLAEILAAPSPDKAKSLGRKVKPFDNGLWEAERSPIVIAGNWAKFSQNPSLANFLLSTNQDILVEASPYDLVWGIGLPADHPDAIKPQNWCGLNLLGFALMVVRDRLRDDRFSSDDMGKI
jgi:ribA/ribD-fused uncharacterized protein